MTANNPIKNAIPAMQRRWRQGFDIVIELSSPWCEKNDPSQFIRFDYLSPGSRIAENENTLVYIRQSLVRSSRLTTREILARLS